MKDFCNGSNCTPIACPRYSKCVEGMLEQKDEEEVVEEQEDNE